MLKQALEEAHAAYCVNLHQRSHWHAYDLLLTLQAVEVAQLDILYLRCALCWTRQSEKGSTAHGQFVSE